ncbi:uncharacterized protein [Antedon mediterranea]|uniref:uncharacterized protein n=1 Tax=Antedon mediterranea TaxID=105859 RepID=UPI003AF92843
MDIQTRIREFIEKRSKNKATKESRPSSPWWRRFSRFRKFFKRQRKTKVSPIAAESETCNNTTLPTSQSRASILRRIIRRLELLRSKSESRANESSLQDQMQPSVSSCDSVAADIDSAGDKPSSPHRNLAWTVSFTDDVAEKTQANEMKSTEEKEKIDPRVFWRLVNADSSRLNKDEWASVDGDNVFYESSNEGDTNMSALSRNLQALQDFGEEMAYMINRATDTWSKICRGPFPHLQDLSKDEVTEMMSRDCIDNTNLLIPIFDDIMKDIYDIMNVIDDHFGLQIDFKDRIQLERSLRDKRPGMMNLAKSYMKPKAFPTANFRGELDTVEELQLEV